MAMMNTGLAGTSSYQNRTVLIDVTSFCQQDLMKRSNYQVRVPYSLMSETMQSITRMGGKVSNVQVAAADA